MANKISVIIPIYNHEEYVVECLKSIVDQNDDDYEIVAIDDGSQDGSYDYALQYLRDNLAPDKWKLSTRANAGICKTINEAIAKSNGDILFLIASDDRMANGSFPVIRNVFADKKNEYILHYYDSSLIDWKGEKYVDSVANQRRGGGILLNHSKFYLASEVILAWGSPFQNQLFSRKYYDQYGPYIDELPYEDLYFALKSISIDRFRFLPLVLKEYRVRKDNAHTPGLTLGDLCVKKVLFMREFDVSMRFKYFILLRLARLKLVKINKYRDRIYNIIISYLRRFLYITSLVSFHLHLKKSALR
jgi:alpha-1,3-rhamnosyltransferase